MAIAVSVYCPFAVCAVFHAVVNGGELIVGPICVPPFSINFTETWLELEIAALIAADVAVIVDPSAGELIDTVGNGTGGRFTVTVTDAALLFPAASLALTLMLFIGVAAVAGFQVKEKGDVV